MIELDKDQYLILNGYVKFDKEEIKKELLQWPCYSLKRANDWINKYTYYRLMRNSHKMFYSNKYINDNSIKQLRKKWIDW